MTTQSVQVKIELGHKATVRKKRTSDGFTHDWTVFVRGPEGSNIQHFVEKVVMHLHDSFPRPKRVLKEPPYQVTESGYAGFNLPIEIYFKNKEEPRKILFKYDLFLHNEGCPPVNHVRCEKLTFQNPTEEFRRKLIKAGGIGVPGPNDHAQYKPTSASTQPAVPHVPPTAEGKAFTDLFGAPLYKQDARKKSKNKDKDKSSKGKNGASPSETTPSPSPAANSQSKAPSSQSKDKTSSNRSSASVSSASTYKSKTAAGAGVIPSKEKATLKRPIESSPSSSDGAKKRRSKDDDSSKEHSKEKKHKSSHSHHRSHSSSSKSDKKRSADTNGDSNKASQSKSSHLQHNSGDLSSGKNKKTLIDLSDGEVSSSSDDDDVVVTEVEASPTSVNKTNQSNGGPLGKLWDEIEQDEEMLSPLPKSSPPQFFSHLSPSLPNSPEKPKSRANGTNDFRLNKVSPSDITNQAAPNGETFAMLLDLQRRLLSVTDKELLHKIVKIIQDTELYQISDSTFDFDLCSLDSKTVGKLQNFLNSQA